jgi:hypothetical protein
MKKYSHHFRHIGASYIIDSKIKEYDGPGVQEELINRIRLEYIDRQEISPEEIELVWLGTVDKDGGLILPKF